MTSTKKGLVRNILSLGGVQIANYIFPLISVPIISRIIGPEKFGVINYAGAFIGYFNMLIAYGFDFTATRKITRDPDNLRLRCQVFSEVLQAQSLLLIVSAFLFLLCLNFVPPLSADKKVAIFSSFICISTLFTQNWIFQALHDLHKVAVLNFVGKFGFTVAVILLIRQPKDYIWQPLLLSMIQIIISIICFGWAYKRYKLKFIRVPLGQTFRLIWEERIVFFSSVVISFYTTTNTVMLGLMRDEREVGFFVAAQRIIAVATSVINVPFTQSLYPYVGNAFGKGKEVGIQIVQKILPGLILVTSTATLCMFLFGPLVLHIFYGKAFAPSTPAFLIMAFVPMIVAIASVFAILVMLNLRMDKHLLRIYTIGGIIGLFLNFVMTYYFGYIGTALNWLVIELGITISMYFALAANGINVIDNKQFKLSAIIKNSISLRKEIFKG